MSKNEIRKIAIIGAGQMGSGIGIEFARFGYQVNFYDAYDEALKKNEASIREYLDLLVEAQLTKRSDVSKILGMISSTNKMSEAAKNADHAVEAVPENLALKQQIFAQLDELCPVDVTLATNSSSMRCEDCGAKAKNHPERILITHYWHPAPFIPLVEVIGGKRTDPAVLERIATLLRSMHKKVVLQPMELSTGPAGWGNAMQHPIENVARRMIDNNGLEPQVVDDIIRFGFGRRLPFLGVFRRYDIIGLDFFYNASKARGEEPWKPVKERVERGETGVKSGKGFYDWPSGSEQFLRQYYLELGKMMKQDIERGDI